MKISVFATTQFEGFHRWPAAPDAVGYLRDLHRHIFHVRAEKPVLHNDREVEFITLKQELNVEIDIAQRSNDVSTWSCEQWAVHLLEQLDLSRCEVSEDAENGAIVEV